MADVFIGYAKEDKNRAEQLAQILKAQGWSVWWDVYIPAGKTFDEVIEKALVEARCVVVLWSKASVTKHWVKTEAERGRKKNILVPVRLEEVAPPLAFELLQAAPLIGWHGEQSHPGLERLLQDIAAIVGPPPVQRDQASQKESLQKIQEPQDQKKQNLEPGSRKTDDFFSVIGKVVVPLAAVAIVAFIIMWFIQPESGNKEVIPQPPVEPAKTPAQAEKSGQAPIVTTGTTPQVGSVAKPAEPKTEKLKGLPAGQVASAPSFSLPKQMPIEITGKDGAPMVLVPAGEFTMGSNDGDADEKPERLVTLEAFLIDKYEVSTKLYAKFIQAIGRSQPDGWSQQVALVGSGDRPVVNVTWHDADAYCRHYGKRLPTEQEWEKAARGTDGRKYPWGNEEPSSRHALFNTTWNGYGTLAESYDSGKSPYGLYHMAGNVWEWTSSDYDNSTKVLRGGSWNSGPGNVRSAVRGRGQPMGRYAKDGFRCAQDAR